MGRGEFIALVAMLFSTVAFSVDALLVAFPAIEQELNAGGTAHYVVTAFMAGLAIGTLFAGPISDAMGPDSSKGSRLLAHASYLWRLCVSSTKAAKWHKSSALRWYFLQLCPPWHLRWVLCCKTCLAGDRSFWHSCSLLLYRPFGYGAACPKHFRCINGARCALIHYGKP